MGTSQEATQDVASQQAENFHICNSKNQTNLHQCQSAASTGCKPKESHLYNPKDINRIWTDGRWKVSPFHAKKHVILDDNAAQDLVKQSISSTTHKQQRQPIGLRWGHFGHALTSATLIILLLLAPSQINESLCNATPSGFLDSGHEIVCEKGKEVSINDYIPITDPALNRCYSCACPNGSIKCSRVEDSPDCMLPPTSGLKTKPRPPASTGGSRFNPSSQHNQHQHHQLMSHHIHTGKPITVYSGKAKAIEGTLSLPRKQLAVKLTTGSPPLPIAQPIGGYSAAPAPTRVRPRTSNIVASGVQERAASPFRYRHTEAIQEQDMHEMFKPPVLPLDDSRHHQIAADTIGVSLEQYLKIHERSSRVASARTSTTAATKQPPTTIKPSSTTMGPPETEVDELPSAKDIDQVESEEELTSQLPEDDWTTTTTTTIATTTEESPQTIWPSTQDNTLDAGEKSAPSPDVDLTQQVRPGGNEIMEHMSQDGILYIAIGVEVFVLVTIFAMMVLFYLFRQRHEPLGACRVRGALSK